MIILSFLFIMMYTSLGGKYKRKQDGSTGRSRTQQDLRRHCCGLYIEPPSSTLTDGSEGMATLSMRLYRALSRWLYRFIWRRRAFFVAQNFKQVGQLYPADLT